MNLRQFFTTHTWWGKIMGCFFGYLMARSLGALIGLLIGNLFDKGLASHFTQPHYFYHQEKRRHAQQMFFEATFSILGYIAKIDGLVTQNEIKMAEYIMQEMRLNKEQKKQAKDFFNRGKTLNHQLDRLLNLFQMACRDNIDLLKLFMDIQYRAAKVDGLSAKKIQALDIIFKRLGFAPLHEQYRFQEDFSHFNQQYQQNYQQHSAPHHQSIDSLAAAYALLNIKSSANKSEVKKAYRRAISRHHPDKLIAQGLSDEQIKRANDLTQKITKAYEQICASKGW